MRYIKGPNKGLWKAVDSFIVIGLAFILLATISQSQNICQNCVDVNTNNFTCNNIGCEGFTLTPSQNSSLNFNTIDCFGNSSNSQCYYSSNSSAQSSSYVIYLFCNYTFPGCSSCNNQQTCGKCQNGYFPNVYNTALQLVNCQYCEDYIGGCQMCYSSTMCGQCDPQYLNVFGFCYTTGGSIVGSTSKPWNKNGSTPTQIITAVELLLICALTFFVIYKFCCQKYPSKKLENNQNLGKLDANQKI